MKKRIYCFMLLFVTLFSSTFAQTTHLSGRVKEVEDAGYPLFVLTISFLQGEEKQPVTLTFNLNAEEVTGITNEQISALKGKYVSAEYIQEQVNMLREIEYNGKNIINPGTPPLSGGNPITGILSGAEAVSQGDLPDSFTITSNNGKEATFEYYITPEMVAINGEKVTAYYSQRSRNTITQIRLTNIPKSGGK